MDELKIEVGKFYKTRCGYKVRIYAVEKMQHPDLYKNIHGAYFDKDRWNCTSWHFNGKSLGPFKSVLDIVGEWEE